MPGWIVSRIGCSSASGGAGMGPKRVELFAAIRFDWQRNQMSVRALARKYDVHRRTVRQAIASPVPPGRKTPERQATVLDQVRDLIDGMLREDLAAPRKQRHTAKRVFERLCDEHGAQASYSYVAKYVAGRRAEITAEDHARAEGLRGFVPQAKDPGSEAEVDFGDVTVCLAGEPARCYMFAFRLSCSGRACHRPIDRTSGPFLVDLLRPGLAMGQASSSLITRTEAGWTRRLASVTCGDWLSPGSGRCARRMIRCCPGLVPVLRV